MTYRDGNAREAREEYTDDELREGDYIVSQHYPEDLDDDGGPGWFVDVWCGHVLGIYDDDDEALEAIQADACGQRDEIRVWYAAYDGGSMMRIDPYHTDPEIPGDS